MNDIEILSHAFLNPKYVQGKRDSLAVTAQSSPYRAALVAEVADLEARLEAEKSIRARRDALLAAAKAIPSKYGPGYVAKASNGWYKITVEQIVAAATSGT